MTAQQSAGGCLDEFAARATEHSVAVTRCSPDGVASAIEERVGGAAVGTPLPGELSLPECVETKPTPAELRAADTGVTGVALAIAEYGTLLLETDELGSEPVSLFVDRHVAVVRAGDIVPDLATAFEYLGETIRETGGSAVLATGPSATADMGSLVQGAHGPRQVEVLVVT